MSEERTVGVRVIESTCQRISKRELFVLSGYLHWLDVCTLPFSSIVAPYPAAIILSPARYVTAKYHWKQLFRGVSLEVMHLLRIK